MKFEFLGREFEFFTSQRQYNKFDYYIHSYLMKPSFLIMLIVLVIMLMILYFMKSRKDEKGLAILTKIWPVFYIMLILSLYVFNRNVTYHNVNTELDNWADGVYKVHETLVLTFFINVLMFIPFGMLLQGCWKTKKYVLSTLVITALFVEELQYFFYRGTTSLSDIISYLIGGTIGIIWISRRSKD